MLNLSLSLSLSLIPSDRTKSGLTVGALTVNRLKKRPPTTHPPSTNLCNHILHAQSCITFRMVGSWRGDMVPWCHSGGTMTHWPHPSRRQHVGERWCWGRCPGNWRPRHTVPLDTVVVRPPCIFSIHVFFLTHRGGFHRRESNKRLKSKKQNRFSRFQVFKHSSVFNFSRFQKNSQFNLAGCLG